LRDSGREIEHVGSTRRAEVFLLDLEIAAGRLEFWLQTGR
jgi:hypothetical protein